MDLNCKESAKAESTVGIITDRQAARFASTEAFEQVFTGTTYLEYSRDAEGTLLRGGTPIIMNLEDPGLFLKDTPENRRLFIRHGFSCKFLSDHEAEDYFNEAVQRTVAFKERIDAINSIKILNDYSRDAEDVLRRPGTEIISDPIYEELFMVDTPENRALFIRNGGTWKPISK